jgi:hypothetical protein
MLARVSARKKVVGQSPNNSGSESAPARQALRSAGPGLNARPVVYGPGAYLALEASGETKLAKGDKTELRLVILTYLFDLTLPGAIDEPETRKRP